MSMGLRDEVARMLFTKAVGPEFRQTWEECSDQSIRDYFYYAADAVIPIIRDHTIKHLSN